VDVLNARRSLLYAPVDHRRAKYDYHLNTLRLKLAIGALGEYDVAMVNAWMTASQQSPSFPGPAATTR
jgi:outer membrane protein